MNGRRVLLVATAALWAGSAYAIRAQRPDQFEPIGPIQQVRGNLYVIPGQGGNTTVFVTTRGVVLVDTKLVGNGPAILSHGTGVRIPVPVPTSHTESCQ